MKSQQRVNTASTPRVVRPSSREATRFFCRSGFREVTCRTTCTHLLSFLEKKTSRIDPRSDPFLLVNINLYSEFMPDLFRVYFTDECDSLEVLEAEVGELEQLGGHERHDDVQAVQANVRRSHHL